MGSKEVASFAPNDYFIFDMHGNIAEMVHDVYFLYSSGPVTNPVASTGTTSCVVRGGNWYQEPYRLRSAARFSSNLSSGNMFTGFRLARTL